ncbi:regulator of Ty1 transposition protein 10 [[Candida] anglica]|uniref:Regulator of Ty1 transposition protein 10 n=1 Tax=[Candida] anglica TaxID=148631 RepID=A0ABP0EA79_9ASCO
MVFNELSSVSEQRLKALSHYGPVTALKVYQKWVIAGYGPILKIFDSTQNYNLIYNQQLFGRNKIHSIAVSDSADKLFIAGGRSFAVLNIETTQDNLSVGPVVEKAINEWVVCGTFLDSNTLLILTAHNMVYKVDCTSFEILEKIHCNEKSILYSGSIRITKDNRVLVAAGTVMSGVLIWDLNTRKILYNLTEHEGSIFGVKINDSAEYIISCSDDRSVKIYDFSTGKLLASGWGHGSRIWNLEFYRDSSTAAGIKIFSTGEDCTARLWQYIPGSDQLEVLDVMDCHLGKHVWSGDIDDVSLQLCVTGGADGRVILHDLNHIATVKHTLDEISEQTGSTFIKKETVKQYFELTNLGLFVVLTSNGQIFILNQSQGKWSKYEYEDDHKLKDFGLLKGFNDINSLVISARNGDLLLMSFSKDGTVASQWLLDEHLNGNKVANILISSDVRQNQYYVLTDCPNPKSPLVLRTFTSSSNGLSLQNTTLLVQPEQSSFTTTCMIVDPVNQWIILGSRYVSVAVYDLSSGDEKIHLGKIFKKISSGDTITSISVISSVDGYIEFLMTVRDGIYMYLKLNSNFELEITHKNKISRGFVEGGFIQDNDLILYGFKSSYFYLWNESKQLELHNELCGGSHRQWDFVRYPANSVLDYKFLYINKSAVNIKSFKNRFSNSIIHTGTHGREIRDVTISEFSESNSKLILTASEDTTVRLGKIHSNGNIETFWSLNGHVSGLQKVKFLSREYAASSAANEEFYIWKITESKDLTPTIMDFAKLKPSSSNPDLRIMDFDTYPRFDENGKLVGFVICTVYSDSNIKIWHFDIETKNFKLVIDGHYTTCCLLNVHFLQCGDRVLLMIGATDGHLAIWDVTKQDEKAALGKVLIKQQLHQSGIKATLILSHTEEKVVIVTGGDDNSLIVSSLIVTSDQISFETNAFQERAASSTITSVNKLNDTHVLVTSVDQIIRTWLVSDTSLSCVSAKYTTIADTGCSDTTVLDKKTIAVIGGAGLSSWEFVN